MFAVNIFTVLSIFSQSFQYFHAVPDLIPGAPGKGTVLDPPPQGTHLPPTAPREGQSPDLTNIGQN